MIELTEQQRQAIQQAAESPLTVVDRTTNKVYVLLPRDMYARLLGLAYDDSEANDEELRLRLARAAVANGWEEPGMDAYDRYDEERKRQCP
jgi:hypothetical protein